MRALRCNHFGPPSELRVEEVPDLVPGPGEVLIEVKAAGINFPDALIIQNKYQMKPPLPFTPGGELAGVVRMAGQGADPAWVGQSVIAFTAWGAFAQQVVVMTRGRAVQMGTAAQLFERPSHTFVGHFIGHRA
jgi:NADPH2:quinone reductase